MENGIDFSSITGIILEPTEYVFLTHKQHHASSSFQVRHPKIAPYLSGKPKVTPSGYNNQIFANDNACKPKMGNKLSVQNYITIPRSTNCSLEHLADKQGMIAADTRLIVRCHNNNMKEMVIVDG